MAAFSMAIVAILLLLFGIVVGVKIGGQLAGQCVTRREYWIANLKVVGVGVVVSALVAATGWLLLAGIPVGGMAGAIATLKMDFGESVGPWKAHDTFFRVNKDQVRRAGSANAEAVRRARRDGTPEPEVISVQEDAEDDVPGGPGNVPGGNAAGK